MCAILEHSGRGSIAVLWTDFDETWHECSLWVRDVKKNLGFEKIYI